MGPAKGKCGVRESVGKAFFIFAKNGRSRIQKYKFKYSYKYKVYIYTYVKKMDKSIFDCFLFLFLDLVTSDIDQD